MRILSEAEKRILDEGFSEAFGVPPQRYFSAPGRTEIGGNHTDHQRGAVLAAAVSLDTRAAVRPNGMGRIRLLSRGWPLCQVELEDLAPRPSEYGTTTALIRGVAAAFRQAGHPIGGFDAYVTSTVLPGSGLSSSAAFEVLIAVVIDGLFCGGTTPPVRLATMAQYAENRYFGKPCGLMDQMASAVGGLVTIDLSDPPAVRSVDFDFSTCGHALCILDTGASHADLTGEYAAIPGEMGAVAACFGKNVLSQVPEATFYGALASLREQVGDRAVLRAIHFYQEDRRVRRQVEALERGEFPIFLELVKESGRSSWEYLQNVTVCGSDRHQETAIALALCQRYLEGRGAYRIHGGGFAGTVQAFVPEELLESFRTGVEAVLGEGACHVLSLGHPGGTELLFS